MEGSISYCAFEFYTDVAESIGYGVFFQGWMGADPWPSGWKGTGLLKENWQKSNLFTNMIWYVYIVDHGLVLQIPYPLLSIPLAPLLLLLVFHIISPLCPNFPALSPSFMRRVILRHETIGCLISPLRFLKALLCILFSSFDESW